MINLNNINIDNNLHFVLIAGPCVIENEEHSFFMAKELKRITSENEVSFIFKSSFDKANRSSIKSYRGPGLEKGLKILKKIKDELDIPVVTDIHETSQINKVAEVADIIQIPAFLCRQTDLIVKSARTNKIVNIKKGQFLSPANMKSIVEKAKNYGNDKIMITERGTSFGYNNLVVDFRSFQIMKSFGCPIIYDATHSVQLPGAQEDTSGGDRDFIEKLTKSAIATGVAGIFMEVHNNPEKALCDSACQFKLDKIDSLLKKLKKIDEIVKNE